MTFVVVQLLSLVWLFATPCTAAHQAAPSFAISWSLLKLMSVESVMLSNPFILCRPLLLLPSIFHIIMAKTLMWLWNLVNLKFFKLYKWGWELQNSCLQGLCNFVLIYMRRWLPFAVLIQPGSWFTLWVTPGVGDWGEDTWGKKWLISLHSAFLVEHLFKVFFFI